MASGNGPGGPAIRSVTTRVSSADTPKPSVGLLPSPGRARIAAIAGASPTSKVRTSADLPMPISSRAAMIRKSSLAWPLPRMARSVAMPSGTWPCASRISARVSLAKRRATGSSRVAASRGSGSRPLASAAQAASDEESTANCPLPIRAIAASAAAASSCTAALARTSRSASGGAAWPSALMVEKASGRSPDATAWR